MIAALAHSSKSPVPLVTLFSALPQVERFQKGEEFLFFQSPAPLTGGEFFDAADPPPNFFSAENFSDMQVTAPQIGVTVVGFGAAIALAGLLTLGDGF